VHRTLLHISMNTSRILRTTVVTSLIAALLCIILILLSERRSLISANAKLAAQLQLKERLVGDLQKQSKSVASRLPQAVLPSQASMGGVPQHSASTISLNEIVKAHPEMAGELEKVMEQSAITPFGDLFSEIDLPPDVLAKVKETLRLHMLSLMDVSEVTKAVGLTPGTPGYSEAYTQTNDEFESRLKHLMGDEKFELLKTLPAIEKIKNRIDTSYASDFQDIGEPLTRAQTITLAKEINEIDTTSSSNLQQSNSASGLPANNSDAAIQENLKSVLSPAQIEIVVRHRAQENVLRTLRKLYPNDQSFRL